jgi:sugar O-acyltransferase (sialic acid O-acetyltransferase NeuD family)
MRYLVMGAAGHAQEVAWALRERERTQGRACDLVFFDDRVPPGPLASGLGSVGGPLDLVTEAAGEAACRLVLGLGLPRPKARVVERCASTGLEWETVIHPDARIGPGVEIGEGSYVAAGAVVTVDVRIGRFVTVNVHCGVAHDAVVGDFASIHPNAHLAGGVVVGASCEIGSGAVVIQGVTIGAGAVLGAGAVAVRSLAGGRTYVGVPATELRR